MYLIILVALADWSYFYWVTAIMDLIINLAIDKVVLIKEKIAIDLSKCFI